MRTLYFDCASGIAGDMAVAALLDLGANHQALLEGLASLGLEGYELSVRRVRKSGVDACGFNVSLTGGDSDVSDAAPDIAPLESYPPPQPRDNDLLRFSINADDGRTGSESFYTLDDPLHSAADSYYTLPDRGGEEESRNTRDFADICSLIEASGISSRAKQYALKIFEVAARAEGKIHSCPPEEVQFHEDGAIDSIVDIVGVSILVDSLGVDRVICSTLCEGQGSTVCRQGVIPVPAPATLEIVRTHNIPLKITGNQGEMVTPTGAAIVAALAESFAPPGEGRVLAVGYGAGAREFQHASGLLRAILIDEGQPGVSGSGSVCELTCNLDDIASEALAFACEELLRAGALDVWVIPAVMKWGRPAHILGLLCAPEREAEFSMLLLRHTSATAIRSAVRDRILMRRQQLTVQTPYGPVLVNESSLDGYHKIKVDFESAKKLAVEKNLSINQILSAAYSALGRKYEGNNKN